ncbi:acetolactate synthase large subunit [Blastococcus sp. TML/M2B]|uniref:acetolactate synthase large subunit n=1 Tax=unclassified Blastococcus TaxID=2619396 RepID=UPI00190D3D10|nr:MULTISPECIES: acetolactate synthase large subunit [unclassified Blastococcus]MBN1093606.1 acetolactate synthase large subunit [Blastococcus sp. TML/M2B]MBN1096274.1 acetolactate synthase large subunit [Blastococcus sp. TML/C7B]
MTTSQSESATREAATALTGVETTARSLDEAAHEPATGITGAQSLVRSLEAIGVDVVFGIPGGAILPLYDPLFDSKVRHVLVRHEQGAGHAATGYAQATGRVGVCMATSGPGATNLVTPLADAYMDSVPIVAITGQVPSGAIGTDAFQEADIRGITMPITKHNFLVTDAADIPQRIAEAFHLASTGRPGPVLVDVPKDVLQATTDFAWPPRMDLPGYRPTTRPHGKQVREAATLIAGASRPVLYVGGGVLKAGATEELAELARLTGAPVVTTLMARGAFPDSDPQHLGMPGMHGTVAAVTALQKSDVLVALGARFDDRVTGQLSSFAPDALVVHADIDPAEIGKNRKADVPIVGDAKETIGQLVTALRAEHEAGRTPDLAAWWAQLDTWRERYPLGYDEPEDGALSPQYVIERLGAIAGPDAIYTSGVGQHQMWAAQFIKYEKPGTWLNSGGLGTMGYAVPAAMGAKQGMPETTVWAIDGDGCFQMTNQELATCAIEGIPIKVAVINNGNLGMVRQWQTLFYEGRYSNTKLHPQNADGTPKPVRIPDFVALAEALGCVGLRCESKDDVDAVIEKAMAITDAPVVIDFIVGSDAQVWPMVAAGASNDDILAARDVRPVFGEGQV